MEELRRNPAMSMVCVQDKNQDLDLETQAGRKPDLPLKFDDSKQTPNSR